MVSQLIEEDALPFNSLEACFSQSFKVGDDGVLVFDFDICFSEVKRTGIRRIGYSLQPTFFINVSEDVWALVIEAVLSPERVSLLTLSESLLR